MAAFLKNTWYMAGWAHEIDDAIVGRTVMDIPLALFRDYGRAPVALFDRCPHRFAPLSEGSLRGGAVMCKYHGLRFKADGACSHNPWSEKIPASCKVTSFPILERDACLWVWLGDPSEADPARIPRFGFLADSGRRAAKGYTHIGCYYELITDNLMDLSHARFLHPVFGGESYNPASSVKPGQETVTVSFVVEDIDNPEFPECVWPAGGKKVDLWDDITWHAPASLYFETGVKHHGKSRREGWIIPMAHIITPETERSSHYFWGASVERDNPMGNEDLRALLSQAFDAEDKPMLEAVQERMGGADLRSLRPVMLPHDAGAIRARRLLSARIAQEQGDIQAASATQVTAS